MSPISLPMDDLPAPNHSAGAILVVGSMPRMAEYQHLVQELRARDPAAQVQGEMVDRLLQGEGTGSSGASTPAHIDPAATTSLNGATAAGGTMKLPRKSTKSRAQKASIWAAESPQLADPTAFLTPGDKVRPECVFPDPSAAAGGRPQKRRRACKDCTCGLAELEAAEGSSPAAGGNDNPTFLLEGDDDIPLHLRTATAGVEGIWPEEKRQEAKKTSLPAFEPGQKVELMTNMDDI
ncbi:hypothetical protein QFC19_008049 [Naganishia cerealis]|uniref:Uncharacterized protein n=1 Tax=Naganishia cerealis TaxID=610337 RepID=A0ACC2V5C1_9TREE|nr:hypothetical protein QFC19_008049 [Naganishia cerealis]